MQRSPAPRAVQDAYGLPDRGHERGLDQVRALIRVWRHQHHDRAAHRVVRQRPIDFRQQREARARERDGLFQIGQHLFASKR